MPLAPEPTLTVPVAGDDHLRGPVDAPVTVVEYGDYECPSCAAARPALAALVAGSAGRARLVFRSFPLAEVHPYALTAALAAEAAGARGVFWDMHDLLFTPPGPAPRHRPRRVRPVAGVTWSGGGR